MRQNKGHIACAQLGRARAERNRRHCEGRKGIADSVGYSKETTCNRRLRQTAA